MMIGTKSAAVRAAAAITASFSVVALAALAPSASASTSNNATFNVTMTLTGAVKGSLTFKVTELETPCTGGTGLGSAGEAGVPSPDGSKVKFNGAELSYAINNASYKGPGTYPTKDFAESSAAISADNASESDPFAPSNNPKSTETLVWNKNGSGSFVFSAWQNGSSNRSLSGKFTWTCKN
jgi:hypothetical protein